MRRHRLAGASTLGSPAVSRTYSVDELRALGMSERLLHIAVNGRHDLEPKLGDDSRSPRRNWKARDLRWKASA